MKTKKYGLRIKDTDILLQYSVVKVNGSEEKHTVFLLGKTGDQEWLLDSAQEVKEVLNNPYVSWYESTENHPYITLSKDLLEVVEVTEIKRIDTYTEQSIYDDLDSYHRQKVEEALQRYNVEKEKKHEEMINEGTIEETSEIQEDISGEELNETMSFVSPKNIKDTHDVATATKTVKAKVKCVRPIPKELGSVRLKSDPVSYCFKEGKHYLAYVKQEKLFMMNEDKMPEFVCNAPTDEPWQENIFFKRHFVIEEYLD